MFSTFPSCSQMPVLFYHSVTHGSGFFICRWKGKGMHIRTAAKLHQISSLPTIFVLILHYTSVTVRVTVIHTQILLGITHGHGRSGFNDASKLSDPLCKFMKYPGSRSLCMNWSCHVIWNKLCWDSNNWCSGTFKTKESRPGLVQVPLFWKSHCVVSIPV